MTHSMLVHWFPLLVGTFIQIGMNTGNEVLHFTKTDEVVNGGEELYQTKDGIIMYHRYLTPRALYTKKWRRNELGSLIEDGIIPAEYPPDFKMSDKGDLDAYGMGAHGNGLFFVHMEKIYKAVFNPPEQLSVIHVRDQLKDEEIHSSALGSRLLGDGMRRVYRLRDDPSVDGVMVDAQPDSGLWSINPELAQLRLKALHRGNLIFERPSGSPAISKLADNVLLIETHNCGAGAGFADHVSPLIYNIEATPSSVALVVYNTETMDVQQFATDLAETCDVVGVHDGKIIVHKDADVYTAQLTR